MRARYVVRRAKYGTAGGLAGAGQYYFTSVLYSELQASGKGLNITNGDPIPTLTLGVGHDGQEAVGGRPLLGLQDSSVYHVQDRMRGGTSTKV
jgi:hypothetical protein